MQIRISLYIYLNIWHAHTHTHPPSLHPPSRTRARARTHACARALAAMSLTRARPLRPLLCNSGGRRCTRQQGTDTAAWRRRSWTRAQTSTPRTMWVPGLGFRFLRGGMFFFCACVYWCMCVLGTPIAFFFCVTWWYVYTYVYIYYMYVSYIYILYMNIYVMLYILYIYMYV